MHKKRRKTPRPANPADAGMTVRRFAYFVLAGTIAVMVTFLVLAFRYDKDALRSFGIPLDIAHFTAGAYTATIMSTLVGFRNVLFSQIGGVGQRAKLARLPDSGPLVVIALFGFAAALVPMFVIASDTGRPHAKVIVGFSAAAWGGSLGVMFERFFRDLGRASAEAKPDDAASSASVADAFESSDGT